MLSRVVQLVPGGTAIRALSQDGKIRALRRAKRVQTACWGGSRMSVSIPPSATGKKQLLIDGKFRDAASGKLFETRNPATGELLATVAEGDAADIDLAVDG